MNEVNTKVLQSLLDSIKVIVDKHNAKIKERRKRGELFNIFDVLGLDSDEVRCHSAFIGELLNVNANHGLGSSFLDAFISATGIENLGLNTDAKYCKTDKECYVGKVTEEEGGRIDILIHSEQKAIIIENKIYASDGYKQLIRYCNYGKGVYGTFIVFYLTLYGSRPKDISTKNKQGESCEYKCISYRENILLWLNRCIELSAEKPLIREVIVQYRNLILSLTNQFMDINENQKFFDLLIKEEYIQGVINIVQSRNVFYKKCLEKYLFPELVSIATVKKLKFFPLFNDYEGKLDLFMFFYKIEDSHLVLKFAFEKYNFVNLMCGLDSVSINQIKNNIKDNDITLEQCPTEGLPFSKHNKKAQFAYGWSYVEECRDWSNQQIFMDVILHHKFADVVKNLMNNRLLPLMEKT